jgi:O-antigen/teichoic acid export membrane protein
MQHKPQAPVVSGNRPPGNGGVSEQRGLLGRIVGYGISRTIVEALLAGRGLLLAGILGPEMFGIWALFRIALRYLAFAGLGLLRGLEFEVSRSSEQTQDNPPRRTYWGEVGAGHTLILYGALSLLAAAATLPGEHVAGIAFLGVALGLLPDRLWSYGITYLRAAGGLRRFAVVELLNAALQVGACVLLALHWGVAGAFVGFAVANVTSIALLIGRTPLRPRFEPRSVYRLIQIGFPVALMGILSATLATVDRLLVGAFLGLGGLGLYAFAVSVSELGVSFAAIVRTVILKDVYEQSRVPREDGASPFVLDHALSGFAALGPPLAGLFALMLPPLIALFTAEFSSVASVAQLLLFAGLIQGFNNVAVLGVVADGLQRRLPLVSVAAVGVNVVLALAAISFGLGLLGVAAASFLTRLLQAAAILVLLLRASTASGIVAAIARLLLPAVWCAAAVYAIGHLLPFAGIRTLALQLLCYTVALFVLAPAMLGALAPRPVRRTL